MHNHHNTHTHSQQTNKLFNIKSKIRPTSPIQMCAIFFLFLFQTHHHFLDEIDVLPLAPK